MGNGQLIFFAGGVAVGYLGFHVIDTIVKGILAILGHFKAAPAPAPVVVPVVPVVPAPVATPVATPAAPVKTA
jgi:hypothetical protein